MDRPLIDFEPYLSPSRGERAGLRVEAAVALAAIPDGARVMVAHCCGTPVGLLQAMAAERARWTRIEIVAGQLWVRLPVMDYGRISGSW